MKNYKLREGENIRKPVVKRDRIEIRMPVLLICLALSFVVWLYIVSLSKLNPMEDAQDTTPPSSAETSEEAAFPTEPADGPALAADVCLRAVPV
jgi:hypothetical protein